MHIMPSPQLPTFIQTHTQPMLRLIPILAVLSLICATACQDTDGETPDVMVLEGDSAIPAATDHEYTTVELSICDSCAAVEESLKAKAQAYFMEEVYGPVIINEDLSYANRSFIEQLKEEIEKHNHPTHRFADLSIVAVCDVNQKGRRLTSDEPIPFATGADALYYLYGPGGMEDVEPQEREDYDLKCGSYATATTDATGKAGETYLASQRQLDLNFGRNPDVDQALINAKACETACYECHPTAPEQSFASLQGAPALHFTYSNQWPFQTTALVMLLPTGETIPLWRYTFDEGECGCM